MAVPRLSDSNGHAGGEDGSEDGAAEEVVDALVDPHADAARPLFPQQRVEDDVHQVLLQNLLVERPVDAQQHVQQANQPLRQRLREERVGLLVQEGRQHHHEVVVVEGDEQ